jgi:hypothetical protein
MIGWYKIYRQLLEGEMWLKEPFTRGQAWVDLIGLANHEDGYIRVRGNRLPVLRGQVGWSLERLAERWKWSRGKVSRFFQELELDEQIVLGAGSPLYAEKNITEHSMFFEKNGSETDSKTDSRKNNISSIITIVNYERYQGNEQQNEPQTNSRRTADGQQTDTNKKEKKEKNIYIRPTLEEVTAYCLERKNGINPKMWIDHYTANGWMVGKNKMKDWKAAVRTWENSSGNAAAGTKRKESEVYQRGSLKDEDFR